jgi:hypothetical protein
MRGCRHSRQNSTRIPMSSVGNDRPQNEVNRAVLGEGSSFAATRRLRDRARADVTHSLVEVSPGDVVRRRSMSGYGMTAESVEFTRRQRVQYHFRAPVHLLVAYEGERRDGETLVEGLPRSTLKSFARKLTFVPADHEYLERHEPCGHTRLMHFNFCSPFRTRHCRHIVRSPLVL